MAAGQVYLDLVILLHATLAILPYPNLVILRAAEDLLLLLQLQFSEQRTLLLKSQPLSIV